MRPAILSTLAALSGLGLTQPSPSHFVNLFDIIESSVAQAVALRRPANQMSVYNAPLMLIGAGPWAVRTLLSPPETVSNKQTVITGFTNIANTLTAANSAFPLPGQLTASDEQVLVDKFSSFSTTQAELVGVVVQAGGAVRMVPAVGPLVASAVQDVLICVDVSCHLPTYPWRPAPASPSCLGTGRDRQHT